PAQGRQITDVGKAVRDQKILDLLVPGGWLGLLLFLVPAGPRAEEFSLTNSQILYGTAFRDPFYGTNTRDGRMLTVTIEHLGVWALGDQYFFTDFYFGDFRSPPAPPQGQSVYLYSEWGPRISLKRMFAPGTST